MREESDQNTAFTLLVDAEQVITERVIHSNGPSQRELTH